MESATSAWRRMKGGAIASTVQLKLRATPST